MGWSHIDMRDFKLFVEETYSTYNLLNNLPNIFFSIKLNLWIFNYILQRILGFLHRNRKIVHSLGVLDIRLPFIYPINLNYVRMFHIIVLYRHNKIYFIKELLFLWLVGGKKNFYCVNLVVLFTFQLVYLWLS